MWFIDLIQGNTRIKCPDGSERIISNNPSKVFPLEANEWSAKWKSTVKSLNDLEISLDGDIGKNIKGFYVQLDQANCSMQMKFKALYYFYSLNPCDKGDWYKNEVSKVIDNEQILRRTELEIGKIKSHNKLSNSEKSTKKAIIDALERLSKSELELERVDEFQRVEKNTLAWGKAFNDS